MPSSHTWYPPPPQYRAVEVPNETTPLYGSSEDHPHKKKHIQWRLLVAVFFLFVLGSVHLFSDWKNSDGPAIRERERRRAQWGEEDRERERNRMVEDLDRERQRAEEDRAREREWEEEDLERERKRVAEDRERERRRVEADLEHGRKQAKEDLERRRKQAAEDSEREHRQAEEDKDRLAKWAEEDRVRLEDEQRRMRTPLYWEGLSPDDQCLRYGTRMYSARLMNIPPGVDGKQWCQETEITIHADYVAKPDFCNEEWGGIYGHWLKTNEPTCKNIWEDFSDKGCLAEGSRKRRVEAKLGFLEYIKGPWREMCTTTPADFWGHHSAGPDTCADTGGRVLGVWLIDDGEC